MLANWLGGEGEFQFLIGRLRTRSGEAILFVDAQFQFLIGRLRTGEINAR